jgi:ligand-binding sensor domain-containing protein
MISKLYIVLFLLLPVLLSGQSTNIGTPFIQNYFKKDYHGGLQTLDIAQSSSGVMYFANNDGLLTFNGTDWQLFSLPKKTNLRSIAIDDSGKIYAGGQNEIGYFFPDSIGVWKFHSLLETLPPEHTVFDDVWDISIVNNLVFFRTAHEIFIFENDLPVNYFSVPKEGDRIDFLQKLEQDILIQTNKSGLLKWNGKTFEKIKNGDFVIGKRVARLLKMPDGSTLVPTLKNGLFKYDGENFVPFLTDIDPFLKENRIHDACLLPNNQIALGTNVAGLVILNQKGQPLWHLTKKRGLQNANILTTFLDASNNLWLGLNNGIDYVKTSSPFQIFYPDDELEGTAYSAIAHDDKIYFGTSNGLYVRDWQTYYNPMQQSEYQLVEGTRGQVWGLSEVNNDLFLGHNEGAFRVENSRAIPLNNNIGAWTFLPDGDAMVAGTYTGLQYFEKNNTNWQYVRSFEELKESSRIMVRAKNGEYWMAHPYRGVYKIGLSESRETLADVSFFGKNNGLPSNLGNYVFCIFNRIIVASETESGLFRYDEATDKFVPDEQLNKIFGEETQIMRLFESPNGDVWYVTADEVGYLKVMDSGLEKKVEKVVLPILKEELVGGFEFILPLDKDNVFIGLEKGFVHYSMPKEGEINNKFPVIISKVVSFGASENVLFGGVYVEKNQVIGIQSTANIPEIQPAQTGVRFTFSSPYFDKIASVQYQYRLNGFEEHFSEPSHKMEKEYTNLAAGTYEFQVRSKVPGGEWSEPTNFRFEMLPPWYATSSAMVIYGLLFLGLLAGLIWIPRRQYKRETEQLIVEHQQVVEKTVQEIDHLKNEKLQSEIEHQNQTLASTTMHLVQKSEILNKLKSELKKVSKNLSDPNNRRDINRLVRLIDQDARLDEDWNQFSLFFDKVHSDFLKKLREKHPNLTPKDHKMCAYLRMNLSTKEITPLMNISVRGVEISRYRLRKKLEVPQGENLIDFLMQI